MNRVELEKLLTWFLEQANSVKYGSVSITAKVHNGIVTFVEKDVHETEQLQATRPEVQDATRRL